MNIPVQTIIIGSGPMGWELHTALADYLTREGYTVESVNTPHGERVPYYRAVGAVVRALRERDDAAGIVICGTGMGVSMIANRFPGIFCALCEHPQAAHDARSLNDANVLALGQNFVSPPMAREIVNSFLTTPLGHNLPAARAAELHAWAVEADIMVAEMLR